MLSEPATGLRNRPHRRFFPTIKLSLLTVTAAFFAAGCSDVATVAPPTPTQADVSPAALRICTTGDYKPLTYRDPTTGQYSGIDIDLANDLAAHLGRTPTFVPTTWVTLMKDIATPDKCDIAMGGISPTPARQQVADFTPPYLANGKTPLTAAANADRCQTVDQINQPGVRVIEPAGGTNEQFAKLILPNATLIVDQDNTAVFGQLVAGTADVMVTDAIEAIYQSKQHPELVAVHPDKPFTNDHKAYMLPKESKLSQPTTEWLDQVLGDGTFTRIYHQWMQ
jgi:cyclohexadienyl dehydratase